jgi:hypothetical protein
MASLVFRSARASRSAIERRKPLRIKKDTQIRATTLLVEALQKAITKVENTEPCDAELLFAVNWLATLCVRRMEEALPTETAETPIDPEAQARAIAGKVKFTTASRGNN